MRLWLSLQSAMALLGRYAHQPRSELRSMPLPTFRAWFLATQDIVIREQSGD